MNYASPIGEVKIWPAAAAPTKYLLCDGAAVSRTTYAALFALIGTTYGVGNGSTTFNLPNLKGQIPVGLDAAQTEFNALGKASGAKSVVLTANESGVQSHGHTINLYGDVQGVPGHLHLQGVTGNYNYGNITGIVVANPGASALSPHSNLQPAIALNYIIRALA